MSIASSSLLEAGAVALRTLLPMWLLQATSSKSLIEGLTGSGEDPSLAGW